MGILDQITGKAIAQQVTEYSEIYGEILIGLHRDVEHLRDDVDRAQQALARAEQKIERLDQQATRLDRQHDALRSEVQQAIAQFQGLAGRLEGAEAELVSLRTAVARLAPAPAGHPEDGEPGASGLPVGGLSVGALWRELEVQRRRVRILVFLCLLSLLSSVVLGVITWTKG